MCFFDLNKSIDYTTKFPIKSVINQVALNTIQENDHGNEKINFTGTVGENNFVIRANVSSKTIRRGLFNPILYGMLEEKESVTHLHVVIKYNEFDYIFIIVFILLFLFAGIYVWLDSNYIINLFMYIFTLLGVCLYMFFLKKLNFRDAKERLEDILSKCGCEL